MSSAYIDFIITLLK